MKQSNTIKSMLQRASVFLLAALLATTAARAQFSGGNSESPVELILGLDGTVSIADVTMLDDLEYGGANQ